MLKRLWMIFGPVLIAGLLVCLLIFFYPAEMRHDLGAEKRSAVATTIESFKDAESKGQSLNLIQINAFCSLLWLQ